MGRRLSAIDVDIEEGEGEGDLPTMMQTKWKGLVADHSYFLNLFEEDCTGAPLYEKFMDGIKNEESSTLDLRDSFNVSDVVDKYVQLVDESTGEQAACCKVDWLYNQNLGKSREEIRGERD